MSDLVKELRDASRVLESGPRGIGWGYALVMNNAADEIIALRERLKIRDKQIEQLRADLYNANRDFDATGL